MKKENGIAVPHWRGSASGRNSQMANGMPRPAAPPKHLRRSESVGNRSDALLPHHPIVTPKNSTKHRGYAYTLESATVLLLLLISLPAMEAFKFQSQGQQDFFLCYDAAGVLTKAFYKGNGLQQTAQQLYSLSGMCISVKGPQEASTCDGETPKDKLAFSIPIATGGAIEEMSVQCFWQ